MFVKAMLTPYHQDVDSTLATATTNVYILKILQKSRILVPIRARLRDLAPKPTGAHLRLLKVLGDQGSSEQFFLR
jgi:hypothetical protein